MRTFQTESRPTMPLQPKKEDLSYNQFSFSKGQLKWIKYLLAVIFVFVAGILIARFAGSEGEEPVNNDQQINPNQFPVTDNLDIPISSDLALSSKSSDLQSALNSELRKYFNPSNAELDTDLSSLEFQYYFSPTDTKTTTIISAVKAAIPYSCSKSSDDQIVVVDARNTLIGGSTIKLRQRKNLDATKSKKIGLYDRTVKVIMDDITNFEDRGKDGIPLAKPKHSKSNNIEEDNKEKYEINRVIQAAGTGIDIQDILSYASTAEFDTEQEFVDIKNQDDINHYFDNTYSTLPSYYYTQQTWLHWTKFDCDVGGNIGTLGFDVQICYMSKQEALNGEGDLDPNCANKINYKIKIGESEGDWSDYQKIQDEFALLLPYVV